MVLPKSDGFLQQVRFLSNQCLFFQQLMVSPTSDGSPNKSWFSTITVTEADVVAAEAVMTATAVVLASSIVVRTANVTGAIMVTGVAVVTLSAMVTKEAAAAAVVTVT